MIRVLGVVLLLLCACVQTTGSALVSFPAYAAGPTDAARPFAFMTLRGYSVSLESATLLVGAVYLNRTVPNWASTRDSCTNPGIYVAQAFGPLEVNLLSPEPQQFPGRVEGTADQASAAEIWLGTTDVYASDSSEVVARFAGTATKDNAVYPFSGQITLGSNRTTLPIDAAQPGSNPPCFLRIISPLVVDVTPSDAGSLAVRIDPRAWFADVEFNELAPSATDATRFVFLDVSQGQPQLALFSGFRSLTSTYSITWQAP
jgi:hypothetical protein